MNKNATSQHSEDFNEVELGEIVLGDSERDSTWFELLLQNTRNIRTMAVR